MAINNVMSTANYFKYMSSAQSLKSSLSPQVASSVNDFVFAQMNNKVANAQNYINQKYNSSQSSVSNFMNFQKEATELKSSFNKAASALKSSSSALSTFAKFGSGNSAIGSSNTGVLSVTGGSLANNKQLNVKVNSLASGQTQKSDDFVSQLGYTLGGTSKLEFTAKGKTSTISFNLSNSVSNKDALTSMAGQINSAKLGVTAKVTTKNGMSSLSLVSDTTGKDAAFTAKFSGKAEKLNMNITETAKNADYTVNDVQYSSAKNDVTLGDTGVKATLTGKGDANINKGTADAGNALNLVKNFANDYNATVKLLKANAPRSTSISDLATAYSSTKYQAQSLARIGITTKSDGQLQVDEKKFSAALKNNAESTRNTLSKLADAANIKTKQALSSSNKLFNIPSFDNQNFGGSYNAYKQFYSNPAATANVLNMML
ncbi:MAG: flagellar filament capping protein FliD [Oscillospiraceae bacterium]